MHTQTVTISKGDTVFASARDAVTQLEEEHDKIPLDEIKDLIIDEHATGNLTQVYTLSEDGTTATITRNWEDEGWVRYSALGELLIQAQSASETEGWSITIS